MADERRLSDQSARRGAGSEDPTVSAPAHPPETISQPEPSAADADLSFLSPPEGPGEIGRLGGYRVLGPLGGGGMGLVFRAEDVQLRRSVALKVIRPDRASDAMRKRFLREARSCAQIEHDHVVPIFQVGEHNGVPFLAMPLLKGRPLGELTGKPLPIAEVIRIGREVSLGLQAAHDRGLVHRDVKPANLWVETPTADDALAGRLGRVKVLDFGLARMADEDLGVSTTGAVMGTPGYLAPEQADGGDVTPRADLFSLGCVLYQLATGRAPFAGKTTLQLLAALATQTPAPARSINPAVPQALSNLIARLLDKDPTRRPADAATVAAELRQMLVKRRRPAAVPAAAAAEENPFAAIADDPAPPGPARKSQKPAARSRTWLIPVLAAGGALLVFLVAAGAVAFVWMPPRKVARTTEQGSTLRAEPIRPAPQEARRWPPAGFAEKAPADQLRLVGEELARRNIGFDPKDGAFGTKEPGGPVLDVYMAVEKAPLKDLEPLKALPKMSQVTISSGGGKVDLAGLKGMPLTYLALSGVPGTDLTALGTLESLTHLTLDGCADVDLRTLVQFPNLRSLILRGPGVAITPVADVAKDLEVLDLDESGITDLGPLAGLPKLRVLRFRKCDVKDVTPLAKLPALEEVSCDYRPAYEPVFKAHRRLARINGEPKDKFFGQAPKD